HGRASRRGRRGRRARGGGGGGASARAAVTRDRDRDEQNEPGSSGLHRVLLATGLSRRTRTIQFSQGEGRTGPKGQPGSEVSSLRLLPDPAADPLREIVERLGQGLAEPLHLGEEQGVRLVAPNALLEKGSDLGPDVLRLAAALVGLLLERGLELVV